MKDKKRGADGRLLTLIFLATLLGLGHHLEQVIRGVHVGWAVTPDVNAFTSTLGIDPVLLIGLYLTLREQIGAFYWVVVTFGGLVMLSAVHLGPWALEPPQDIIGPYQPRNFGYVAFGWLAGSLVTLFTCDRVCDSSAGVSGW